MRSKLLRKDRSRPALLAQTQRSWRVPIPKKIAILFFFEEHALLEASGFREPSKEVAREVSKEEPTTWRPGLTGSGSLSISDFGKMIA